MLKGYSIPCYIFSLINQSIKGAVSPYVSLLMLCNNFHSNPLFSVTHLNHSLKLLPFSLKISAPGLCVKLQPFGNVRLNCLLSTRGKENTLLCVKKTQNPTAFSQLWGWCQMKNNHCKKSLVNL